MGVEHRVYDVFLSYNSQDRGLVERIARALSEYGIRVWYDQWSILKGQDFQRQIENGLAASRSVAVFVGKSGFGAWGEQELRAALLDNNQETSVPVIPVLLPGSSDQILPAFLRTRASVQLGDNPDQFDALSVLIAAVEGVEPSSAFGKKMLVDLGNRPIARPVLTALQAQTIHAYDQIAEKFTDRWFEHPPTDILDLFLEHTPKAASILDAGCGPGHHSQYLKRANHTVIGVDLSSEMLKIARSKVTGAQFQRMDIGHLGFERQTFDAVWCAACGIHVPRELLTGQLYEFRRVLKPNGLLGLNLQIDRVSEIAEDGRFFEFYESRSEIVALLAYVGYDVIAESYGETRRNTHDLDLTLKWVTLYCRPNSMGNPRRAPVISR
jgi:SAM-dependent methyltransferase